MIICKFIFWRWKYELAK